MAKTIAVDEEGFFLIDNGIRINDDLVGRHMLEALTIDEFGVVHMDYEGQDILVEAFEKPYVARQVHFQNGILTIQLPHQTLCEVDINSLCVDEWDRFHGKTNKGIPFILSHPAQAELFSLAEEFTDDSIQLAGRVIQTPNYYITSDEFNEKPFWSEKYQSNTTPWNLDKAHPELSSFMQQLKLNKCRILVPGCGYGHDAALLAEQGHLVTAVDISDEALAEAEKRYGHIPTLTFKKVDVLNLSEDYNNCFDVVFEHTFYCAISPEKRNDLIKIWRRVLCETGHLLGIFFVVPKRTGPYFGGSEWELREKLKDKFNFLYWTRLKHSPGWRNGAELMIYAQIKESH
ncbi:MAG: methyltransferase domain-containing protein [Pseudomonadota bacterium]